MTDGAIDEASDSHDPTAVGAVDGAHLAADTATDGAGTSTDDDPASSRWATSVVLGDGESAFIRPLVPADQPALLAFHLRQSRDSVYRRFFSPKPTLSSRELDHFTRVDMHDRVALAVEVRDEFVAWASYERWSGRNDAEAAFMVDDEYHGRGIATLLLEHLAAIARTNGIERFTAEVLADNRGMLAVFAKAGWPLERRFESGVVDLDWELATTDEFMDSVERREQRADSRAVARILLPRAVAVIGASDRPDSVGHLLWTHLRRSVSVPVYPVNPRLEDLDGQRCFGSVGDLPDDVSLGVIAVPTRALEATIDDCIAKRMRGAIVVTSLDDEDGLGVEMDRIVARARRNGLRLIGPSSMGVASLHAGSALQASLVDVALPAGNVAISMQSGSLGASLLRRADDLTLGLSWFVSLGDKSDVSANDLLQFWENDETTSVIGLYTETFGNPRKFARIARRVSRSRPIVAVRTGVAADGPLGGALYHQAGLIEVPSVHALLDTCRVFAGQPVLCGPRVAVVSNSTSPATLASAALETNGLVATAGPVHLDWRADPTDYERAITAALGDDGVDGVLVIYAPPVPAAEDAMSGAIASSAADSDKPVVAVMIGAADGPVEPGSDVPAFIFPEQAAAALGSSYAYGRWLDTEAAATTTPARIVDPARAAQMIDDALARSAGTPEPRPDDEAPADGPDGGDAVDDGGADDGGEATRPEGSVRHDGLTTVHLAVTDVTALLSTYGIDVAAGESVPSSEATDAAARIGYPVAVKALRRAPGRSAKAGVALDLNGADDVEDAVATMHSALGVDADFVLVQEMVDPGIPVRIRCERDDRLGAIVSVGYGGVDADVVADQASRLAPMSPAAAVASLNETRVGAALAESGIDTSPLVDTIVQASQLCADHHDVDLLDLNPVVVSATGAIVTDAVVVLFERPDGEDPIRRLG